MSKMIPFGKYKGQPIEVLENDPEYAEWIARQDWAKERFPQIVNVIINKFGENEETPEHNAMQAKFMNREYCAQAAEMLGFLETMPLRTPERHQTYVLEAERIDTQWGGCIVDFIGPPAFEAYAIDVSFNALTPVVSLEAKNRGSYCDYCDYHLLNTPKQLTFRDPLKQIPGCRLELKPIVSDDYPAILRQMRNSQSNALVYGSYTGVGVAENVFREFFGTQGIAVASTQEIESEGPSRLQAKTERVNMLITQQVEIFRRAVEKATGKTL